MVEPGLNRYLLSALREDLESLDPQVRKRAIYTLGRLGKGPEVLDVIRRISMEDPSAEVRYTARKALFYLEDVVSSQIPAAVDVSREDGTVDPVELRRILFGDDDSAKMEVLLQLVRIGDSAVVDILLEALEREEDPWLLALLVKTIGALGDATCVRRLARFLSHPNTRVVANTIEALEMVGDESCIELIEPFLSSEDNRIRANAVKAMYMWEPARAFSVLEGMCFSLKEWMRASAVYCLKVIDEPQAMRLLLSMMESEVVFELFSKICDVIELKAAAKADVEALLDVTARLETPRFERAAACVENVAARVGMRPSDVRKELRRRRLARQHSSRERPAETGGEARRGEDGADSVVRLDEGVRRYAPATAAALVILLLLGAWMYGGGDGTAEDAGAAGRKTVDICSEYAERGRWPGKVSLRLRFERLRKEDEGVFTRSGYTVHVEAPASILSGLREGDWCNVVGTFTGRDKDGALKFSASSLTIVDPPKSLL